MCLEQMEQKKKDEVLKKLPDEFTCWKVMHDIEGRTLFHDEFEPLLKKHENHTATNYPTHREEASKTIPGFHVFLSRKDAIRYGNGYVCMTKIIVKFRALKANIIDIGNVGVCDNFSLYDVFATCITLSKITRK